MKSRALLGLVGAIGLTVALTAAAAAVQTGAYKGTNSEHTAVTFTVTAHAVTHFSDVDAYGSACHFQGGAGGFPVFKISIASMALTATGHFSAHVTVANKPFPGTTQMVVAGHFVGAKVVGTVNAVNKTCGSFASNPTTNEYFESFTATRG